MPIRFAPGHGVLTAVSNPVSIINEFGINLQSPHSHDMAESPIETRPSTPPHHPIYGVHMSHEAIRNAIAVLFPDATLTSITSLASGRSYNNRLYFLKLGPQPSQEPEQELVLKVNGRFFGATKVQNEVASLRILRAYCPEVPAPRVFAWSEDGRTAVVAPRDKGNFQTVSLPHADDGVKSPGWILMERVPGEPINVKDAGEETLKSIGSQLADLVACWRTKVPAQRHCGNLLSHPSSSEDTPADISLGPGPISRFDIRGLLGDGIPPGEPIPSNLELHKIRIQEKLRILETSDTYAPNRDLASLLKDFVSAKLPILSGMRAANTTDQPQFIFTHFDLSPRNTLVSGSPPRITGIVDFEFSGFFPPSDEFVNDYVDNGGDWPRPAYDAYLARLESLEVATPAAGFEEGVWRCSHELGVLTDNIAPWWLPGGFGVEKLAASLVKCRGLVLGILENIR